MFNLKISGRIYLLVALAIVALLSMSWVSVNQINATRDAERRAEIQAVTETAVSVVNGFYEQHRGGNLSAPAAMRMAKTSLESIRSRGGEYIFINDLDGVVIGHGGQPGLVGMDQTEMVDVNGKAFVSSLIDIAKRDGSGFDYYYWVRPGSEEAILKQSYVKLFEPWGWVIGTGLYMDDLEIAARDTIIQMAGIAALVGLVVIVIAGFITRTITSPLGRLTNTMARVADGQFDIEVKGVERRDEIGGMARAVEVFRENGLKVSQMTEAEAARVIRDHESRQQMMTDLQVAFGDVVDAAVDGDFSRRVAETFPDAELNALARSVNTLVENVDDGLAATSEVLGALANTDLTRRMEGEYRGAFAKLKTDLNEVGDKLTSIVGQLRDTSGAVKSATGEILSGANDLSERTTRQAGTIEETSAAMEQLAQTVRDNAAKAADASEKAGLVSGAAEAGGRVMSEANEAMERITQSSAKISNIIGMIDDIAFQTNLLALNASVEAARAGEAGKGFAVVAVEVRRLAQSAAQASSDVKVLIEQSAQQVTSGSKLVATAADRLTAMLDGVRANTVLLDDIARASREQASAIAEVNSAVRQMDEMTQHNAALVEEVNAAIEQTEAQANELDRIVDVFTIDAGQRSTPAAAPGAAGGASALQAKARKAASSYLTNGSAAMKDDWSEF
jgi:methyl-accepting chemotaxis protein